jgi:membrane-bound lytic murein transglycosylase MltF
VSSLRGKWIKKLCVVAGYLILANMPCQVPPIVLQAQTTPEQSKSTSATLALPLTTESHLGDLDGMLKRHEIRVLVVYSRSGFFYNAGRPEGIFYEAFEEFQRFANERLKFGPLKVEVTYLPVSIDALGQALLQGKGDVIGFPVIVTPEREKEVLFTTPIGQANQVLVTGPSAPAISNLDELSGKEVYVNPVTAYYDSLRQLSDHFRRQGKPPIVIKEADHNLTDEDLLEMVGAGLVPATVTLNLRAQFWSKVFPQLKVHSDVVVQEDGVLALATRRDSPELRQLLDEYLKDRRIGTSFGNTLVRRYLQNTEWVKNVTSTEEMKKFRSYVHYFQKYATQYNFDYLMLVGQGYQESHLDQSKRSPGGAVGIMQVIPKYAAAPPIGVPDVENAEANIHAGAKILRNIVDTYLNDPSLDATNKLLLAFASYNAGPNRIAQLRRKTKEEGLDPNQWFGNVELVVAKEIGEVTVQYVNNIYKYYVAYKLVLQEVRSQ